MITCNIVSSVAWWSLAWPGVRVFFCGFTVRQEKKQRQEKNLLYLKKEAATTTAENTKKGPRENEAPQGCGL